MRLLGGERGTQDKSELDITSQTQRELGVQNGGEIKSHMVECKLIEMC